MNDKQYTSVELIQLLRKKYKTDTIANGNHPTVLLEQVANATGFDAGRWVDAAVFEMWPMHGLTRRAFEIKVSRGDFLRELKHPDKYQWCRQFFHEFWYVAPKDVIKIEELPEGVGWLYPAGSRLSTARQASHNRKPELNDTLLASFLRSAVKEIENAAKRDKQQLLNEDEGYKKAKLYEKATERFIQTRNHHWLGLPENEEVIVKALEEATLDNQLKEDREHLQNIADTFQRDLAQLFNLFAVIASKGILARDELGKLILERWGEQNPLDKQSLKKLKNDNYSQRYNQVIETLLHWESF